MYAVVSNRSIEYAAMENDIVYQNLRSIGLIVDSEPSDSYSPPTQKRPTGQAMGPPDYAFHFGDLPSPSEGYTKESDPSKKCYPHYPPPPYDRMVSQISSEPPSYKSQDSTDSSCA